MISDVSNHSNSDWVGLMFARRRRMELESQLSNKEAAMGCRGVEV